MAALQLFAERGYDSTTVAEIAERAGLTKSTFFRHFRDKREVLFGADTMSTLLSSAISAAPATASPLEVLAQAIDAVGETAFTPDWRPVSVQRRAVIAANAELQEREALKELALTAAMTEALKQRGVSDLTSRVAAQLGALAMKLAYEQWCDPANAEDFGALARRTLTELQAAGAECAAG